MKKEHFDVVIIGAGVIGAGIARELARYRIKTAIIEKEADVSFGTSKANSGVIHAGFHSQANLLKTRLTVEGNRMFDSLAEELEFPFQRRGELMVAFTEDELRVLQSHFAQGEENHVPYMELMGRERLFEMEPNLSPDMLGALYAPTAGIVCPYEYCFSLVENAVNNGVSLFLDARVVGIAKSKKGDFKIETEDSRIFSAGFVVNAAGLFADEIASYAGEADFKILPRKGEEYLLDKRVSSLVKRIIFPVPTPKSKGMLVIPTVDGTVMVGPTAVDVENKTDLSTTREGLKEIFAHAQKMVPSIRMTDIITSFAGLRPVATGDDFIIGPTNVKGFINAAGIQSPGLTASPAIALMVKDILIKEGLRLEVKSSFNPKRKSVIRAAKYIEKRNFEKIDELIAADKNYSKLVCRCENVTEAEVIAAVRKGHVTLDAIKFATRAESGRCQGGFCTSRVMKIIERETGIPLEKITKKGAGSEILPLLSKKGC